MEEDEYFESLRVTAYITVDSPFMWKYAPDHAEMIIRKMKKYISSLKMPKGVEIKTYITKNS